MKVMLLYIIALIALRNEVSGEYVKKQLPSFLLKEGMSIKIKAKAAWLGYRYDVNLLEGTDTPDVDAGEVMGNIQFHLSVRFKEDDGVADDTVLVLNSFEDGHWQREERYNFGWYIPYTIQITARKDHWEIRLDESKSYTFKYRKPIEELEKIKFLVVQGSIKTELITFCTTL